MMAARAKASKATQKKARGATPASKRLEPVLAFRASGTQLVFRVFSGGCTETEHFRLDVRRRNGKAEVTLTRLVPDNCKGDFTDGAEIRFSYAKIGLDRSDVIRLCNPVRQAG
jgi:hypothetical protein